MNGSEHLARGRLCRLAESLLWTPYRWGGDDPSGFDCSGLVVELLKSVGIVAAGDWTADGLMQMFPPCADGPQDGDLVFFGQENVATHVEVVWSSTLGLSIGASGGGSKTQSTQDAWDQNAYIKVRPILRGRKILGFRDPFGKFKEAPNGV